MHSKRGLLPLVYLAIIIFTFIPIKKAEAESIEAELQSLLIESLKQVDVAIKEIEQGGDAEEEITRLIEISEDVKILHLLLNERFRQREGKLKGRASERHGQMRQRYAEVVERYIEIVDRIQHTVNRGQRTVDGGEGHKPSAISHLLHELRELLQGALHKKKRQIFGSLPYRHLSYPHREPVEGPSIRPAYLGGDRGVRPGDTASTELAPISEEIAELAQSLKWSPVMIYEYVKNQIETEWYWGCMKGAVETLRQGAGNDCDQAALLVALLRASGYPARYVRGVIEFFAGRDEPINKIKNLVGVEGPEAIAEYFQKAGIPYRAVIQGGRIVNFQIEHIWVETQIPYANYRGAIIDEHGKTWLGLDTSIKVSGYEYHEGLEGAWQVAEGLMQEYLSTEQALTPLEYLRDKLTEAGYQPSELKRTRTLIPEVMKIVPASMQFRQIIITNEYEDIPDELIHKVRFAAGRQGTADGGQSELFDVTLPVYRVSSQRISITYEPETVEDQEVINSYGGLGNTPSYLVRLRPVLKVADERVAVGGDGLSVGQEYTLTVELISPNGTERVENTQTVGNLTVMGIVSQKTMGYKPSAISQGPSATSHELDQTAEDLLFQQAVDYIKRWDEAEEEIASLLHLNLIKPVPTVVTVGGLVEVTYLLDSPQDIEFKGVYIDADLRAVETVESHRPSAIGHKLFMELSALQGSVLEHRIFQENWQVGAISTAKLIEIVNSRQQTGEAVEIITINKDNIDIILSTLRLDEDIMEDIQNSVNQGLVIHLPYATGNTPYAITHEDWEGIGYIKEDPETAEAGYMLTGGVAGGMTAWSMERWPKYLRERLLNPYSEPPEYDPTKARYIHKVTATDMQEGRVGRELSRALQVVVYTAEMRPVKGAEVTFTVKAGGGLFSNGQGSITVKTDYNGIASARFIPGRYTKDNPTYLWYEDIKNRPYPEQVGENIVDARLSSGAGITVPFTVYGFPGQPHHIRKLSGDGQKGMVLAFAGFVSVAVEDEYGNPISNIPVDFEVLPAIQQTQCVNPNEDTRPAYLIKTTEPCVKDIPVWRECEKEGSQDIEVRTTPDGASVQVVLGGAPGAEYPIEVKAEGLREVFHLYTYPFGNCDGDSPPEARLIVQYTYPSDPYGNNIDAGSPGSKIPLKARMYYLVEKGMDVDVTLNCGGSTRTCPRTVGARQYEVVTEFKDAALTFSGIEGIPQGGGIYTALYTLQPGLNTIEIQGSASMEQTRSIAGCATCNISDTVTLTDSATATMEVYGVEIGLQQPPVILIDSLGFTKEDYAINYTITPAEYRAYSGYLIIYKDKTPVEYIPIEPEPEGSVTLSRGFWFDAEAGYEAQIILNYGTGVEIRSSRVQLPVARIRVLNDNEKEVEEIRYSDGGRPEDLYQVELISKALAADCGNLTGKIKTVNRQWADTTAPDVDNYYPTGYPLQFELSSGRCLVKIKDTTNGQTKDRFIVSNLSRIVLDNRILEYQESGIKVNLQSTAVLYGGIGNQVEVEINSAREHIPIEPVGVVVIGIDGLRQDVLYGPDEATYSDPEGCGGKSCYISPLELPGLSQIMTPEGTIKLKDVTAILPSITFASWASIFTGKMPKETGIVGNEFFGRDIYKNGESIPGMAESGIPEGIVSLSGGAFLPGKGFLGYKKEAEFAIRHAIPAEFFSESNNLSGKLGSSAPIASLLAEPFFVDVGEKVVDRYTISYDQDVRCDRSGYECRTVAMFNHYAEGADWWGTPSVSWENAFDAAVNMFDSAKVMDMAATNETVSFIKNYFTKGNIDGKRKKFPAVFTVYFSGLDHYAHSEGMGGYSEFFMGTTDPEIRDIVKALKDQGEFDNKIFIITADHGHTEMPHPIYYKDPKDGQRKEADTSCKLKLEDFDKENTQNREKYNNNLHIWELGEILKAVGSIQNTGIRNKYRLLVPEKIEEVFKNEGTPLEYRPTSRTGNADIVVAFNGPMAHIYSMIVSPLTLN